MGLAWRKHYNRTYNKTIFSKGSFRPIALIGSFSRGNMPCAVGGCFESGWLPVADSPVCWCSAQARLAFSFVAGVAVLKWFTLFSVAVVAVLVAANPARTAK